MAFTLVDDNAPPATGKFRLVDDAAPAAKTEPSAFDKWKSGTSGVYKGLVSGVLGVPGDVEHTIFRDVPHLLGKDVMSEKQYRENMPILLPTTQDIQKGLDVIGWKDPTTSFGKKAERVGELMPAVAAVGKGVLDLGRWGLGKLSNTAAKNAPEALRTEIGGQLGKAQSSLSAEQAATGQRLSKVGTAQEKLAAGKGVARRQAGERTQEVQTALDTLSKERPLGEDVMKVTQEKGLARFDALKKARQEGSIKQFRDPLMQDAAKREAAGDLIATNPNSKPVLDEALRMLKKQIEDAPSHYRGDLEKRYQTLFGEVSSAEEPSVYGEMFGVRPKPAQIKHMTMEQADQMRRILGQEKYRMAEGVAAIDGVRASKIAEKLEEAMRAYDPRMGKYIDSYKELSKPIEKMLSGRGEGAISTDIHGEENLFPANRSTLANWYFGKDQQGAQALKEMWGGESKELTDAVAGKIRRDIEDMSADQIYKYFKDHEGFLREFPDVSKNLSDVITKSSKAEKMAKQTAEGMAIAEKRLAGRETKARGIETKQKAVMDTLETTKRDLNAAISPEQIQSASRDAASRMRKADLITADEYETLKGLINKTIQSTKDVNEQKKKMMYLLYSSGMGFTYGSVHLLSGV